MNLQLITNKVCELVIEVGKTIKEQQIQASDIQIKSKNSLVTFVDKAAEKELVEKLNKLIPNAGFITEEDTLNIKGVEYNWIIDPLDGTTNFIHKLPCYSISVALQQNNKTILGVVYEINNKELFFANINSKAFLNNQQISVSTTKNIEDSLIATGFPYYDYSRVENYLKLLEFLMRSTRGVRRFGSAAVDLSYVACGRFDAFFEYSLNSWDVAAGAFIVQQAGGKVYDFKGKNDYLYGREITACNLNLSKEFNMLIQKSFT